MDRPPHRRGDAAQRRPHRAAPRRPLADDDVRDRLLAALDRLLAQTHPSALSLREVARTAGVSHGLPGYYFGDRQGLLAAYADAGFGRLAGALRAAAAEAAAARPAARLAAILVAYLRFARQERCRFAVMFQTHELSEGAPDLPGQARRALQPLHDCVEGYFAARPAAPGSAEAVGLAAWSLVHGAALLLQGSGLAGRTPEQAVALEERLCRDFADAHLPDYA